MAMAPVSSHATPPPAPLAQRARQGLAWSAGGTAASIAAQLVLMAVMARLVEPAAFGLVAMALVAMRLVGLATQLGLGPALIQRDHLEVDDVRAALGLTLGAGLAGTVLLVVAAPLVAHLYGRPDVAPVLQGLALSLLPAAVAGLWSALLRRALRLQAATAVELGSYLVGYGAVGVALAWAGAGVWALVGAAVAQALAGAVLGALCVGPPRWPGWRGLRAARGRLAGYGSRHTAVTLAEFAAANLDTALIGRLLGETVLGLYNRALLLATLPAERLAGSLTRVLFPLVSGVQADARTAGAAGLLGVAAAGMAAAALGPGVAAAAGDVVAVLLGPRWAPAVPLLQLLAWVAPPMFVNHVCGVLCDATAQLGVKLRVQLGALVLFAVAAPGLCLGLGLGAAGVAAALLLTEGVRLAAYLAVLSARMHWRAADLARVLGAVAVVAGVVHGGVAAAAAALHGVAPPLVALMVEVAAGAVALAVALAVAARLIAPTAAGELARRHVPGAQRWMALVGAAGR